jgi:hypothetical protein
MGIMCSEVTETGLVTFDLGIGPDGRALFRVAWWNGSSWGESYYGSFKAAHKTYKLISRMI